jgi:hypothetical protein
MDDNGDGVVTAAEIRLKLSDDKELQKLLSDVLTAAGVEDEAGGHLEHAHDEWAKRAS